MKRDKLLDVLFVWPLLLTKERLRRTRFWFVFAGLCLMIALIVAAQFINS